MNTHFQSRKLVKQKIWFYFDPFALVNRLFLINLYLKSLLILNSIGPPQYNTVVHFSSLSQFFLMLRWKPKLVSFHFSIPLLPPTQWNVPCISFKTSVIYLNYNHDFLYFCSSQVLISSQIEAVLSFAFYSTHLYFLVEFRVIAIKIFGYYEQNHCAISKLRCVFVEITWETGIFDTEKE